MWLITNINFPKQITNWFQIQFHRLKGTPIKETKAKHMFIFKQTDNVVIGDMELISAYSHQQSSELIWSLKPNKLLCVSFIFRKVYVFVDLK